MPLISVLLAVHDGAGYLPLAVRSILGQTLGDLELVAVDDASTDATPDLLAAVDDPRLVVLRNERQLGLAASLNHALERAGGRYVARLDADDVAFPERLERQVARMERDPVAVLGTAVLDVDEVGHPGTLHRLPAGLLPVRWHALFGAPFFHPTVLVDRELLDAYGLRYDPSQLESEDYELWSRVLAHGEGDNLPEPLVAKRVHGSQASARRADLQVSFQREVALAAIARVAPGLSAEEAELAWSLGSGRGRGGAADYVRLLAEFEARHGVDRSVRSAAGRALARGGHLREALGLVPTLPLEIAAARTRRARAERAAKREASAWLERPGSTAIRVVVVSPEPTPYRAPLFDRLAERPELDLTVVYAAPTVAGRTWTVEPRHRAVFLRGVRLPGAARLLRHDYPVTPRIQRALRDAAPDVVVVSGWSTFSSQAAIAWARAVGIPYVLHVESHDLGPRAGWRRAVKGAAVPRLIRGAASVLVVGTAAHESVVARGARADRVRVFANTIDAPAWIERAERLRPADPREDVVVLSVARLAEEKGLDVLVRAVADAGDERLRLVVAGEGPDRDALDELARGLGVRLELRGALDEEALAAEYAAADVFALLSFHEPWGVVVNEAAASGLPLVLSDRVGAARDLLRDGENGFLVQAGDVAAVADALRKLAADAAFRSVAGACSRELVRGWGYEPSVEAFVAAVREATSR